MEQLVTASMGLTKSLGRFYVQVISANKYEFYFFEVTEWTFNNIARKEGLEFDERDELPGLVSQARF